MSNVESRSAIRMLALSPVCLSVYLLIICLDGCNGGETGGVYMRVREHVDVMRLNTDH